MLRTLRTWLFGDRQQFPALLEDDYRTMTLAERRELDAIDAYAMNAFRYPYSLKEN